MPTAAPAVPSHDLLAFSSAYVSHYILAAVRVLAALMFNPLLGSARVPMPGRIGLGLFATLVIFPMSGPLNAPAGGPPIESVSIGPTAIAGELLIGLLAGFAVTLIFGGVQFAGGLIGINSGFSFAQTLNPLFEHGGGVIETFFSAFALLVFVEINGHHLFLMGLAQLFEVVPVGQVGSIPGSAESLIALSGGLFSAGVKLALPVMAALLLADLAFGLLARVAPQFNLFALELPAKMLVGLAALAVALPIILPRLTALFRTVPASMLTLVS